MVEVIGNCATISVGNISWDFAEVIPDTRATSFLSSSSFNLVGSSGDSPSKVRREIVQTARREVSIMVILIYTYHVWVLEVSGAHHGFRDHSCHELIDFSLFSKSLRHILI